MTPSHDAIHRPLRLGDSGLEVAEVRSRLAQVGFALPPGDIFDEACERAVRTLQQQRGLSADGRVGAETHRALDEARWRLGDRVLSFTVSHPLVGDDIAELQRRLTDMGFDCGKADGIFAGRTETAVREFQRNVGLVDDGTCGPATFRALLQLARTVVGGRPQELREYERLHHAGPTLAGKLIVLDPAHGGPDRGIVPDEMLCELDEAAIVDDLAHLLEGKLAAAGAQAFRTRGSDSAEQPLDDTVLESDRVAFANGAEADLLISLHVDGGRSATCQGVATYYFGSDRSGAYSPVGRRLAQLVLDEIVARTDLLDCRAHAKTYHLLRTTRMPAVRIDLGYLTNPGDAMRLGSSLFRDHVAEAIVAAIQRLYEPAVPVEAPLTEVRLSETLPLAIAT
jgi:N-acetylmuramoyl-L-alanine amidase